MKKVHALSFSFVLLMVAGSFQSANAQFWNKFNQNNKVGESVIEISFEQMQHDFGKVERGNYPDYTFAFKNTSDKPVKVVGFDRACNVTIPAYTKEVIQPGEEGYFKVVFNTRDINGEFRKHMNVIFTYQDEITKEHVMSKEIVKLSGSVAHEVAIQD
ncbi:MAG: DUF1573 domain-containing protein [Bacteroidia bacterium]